MAAAAVSTQPVTSDPGPASTARQLHEPALPAQAAAHSRAQQRHQQQQQQPQQQQLNHQQQQQPGETEFVNEGLLAWQERRRQWTSRPPDYHHRQTPQKRRYTLSVTPEEVLSFEPLPQPAPLWEVVEVLCEVWEEESMYG